MSELDDIQSDDNQSDQNTSVVESEVTEDNESVVTEDNNSETVEDTENENSDDSSENSDQSGAADKEQGEDTQKQEEQPQESEADRNRRFYEQRQEEKRQRQMIEKTVSENYQAQPLDELTQHYVDQGYDEFQATMLARDEVREQNTKINEARAQIAELNLQINSEAMQVMHDFPEFDPGTEDKPNPLYNKALHDRVKAKYAKYAATQIDPNTGLIVQTEVMPYEFYKGEHEMWEEARNSAQVSAQRNLERQMNRVAPPTSVVTKRTEDFNSLNPDQMAERLRAKGHDF